MPLKTDPFVENKIFGKNLCAIYRYKVMEKILTKNLSSWPRYQSCTLFVFGELNFFVIFKLLGCVRVYQFDTALTSCTDCMAKHQCYPSKG